MSNELTLKSEEVCLDEVVVVVVVEVWHSLEDGDLETMTSEGSKRIL